MQKLQDSVFTLVKTTNLSPAVFSFLQPTDDSGDKTPLGGILRDTKYGWLALGPKFCVVDLRTGMKVAARTFGATLSTNAVVTSVVELPTPLTENSQQLIISLQCDDISIIVMLNINGSQILRCIQTDVVVTELAICDDAPDGIFSCFDGIVIAGTSRGEIFAFDLNRATLIQALKDISQGYEHLIQNELKPTNLSFLPLDSIRRIDEQRELALENDHHLAVLLNENSFSEGQYIFRNPDCTVRMKAKRDHIRVTVLEYIPQAGSVAVGFNFGAFQIWNLMNLDLEFTSQVNVECLPVTHFGFQEPCDDPRAFCYLWVIFSVLDRHEEEEFPLAVMYSLTYQGKRMLSDTKCLYQDFSSATIRFQVELNTDNEAPLLGGKCISCHTYSIKSSLGDEGEDSMLNLCQLVWESWGQNAKSPMQYGMLLFDLDQWYKDQMPSSYRVESNAFLSASSWAEMSGGSGSVALHARLDPASVTPYSHATRLEEHFYPNSLQYNCICLNTSEVCVLSTIGIQRQIISSLDEVGPTVLLHPPRLYAACAACGLAPLYALSHSNLNQEEQRRYLLSVALEARLARFLKRCAHDWATGSHSGVGCTLQFLVDWCWKRAIELKENAKELTAPLFISAALPDRNIVRCLEHCVQQLTQLTGLMDAILTKCCNLVVPDALSEIEEKHKGISTVSLYFQVVQWFLRVGLLPERVDGSEAMPYPAVELYGTYNKRRLKLNRIQGYGSPQENSGFQSCSLLYIDQLLEHDFGGERIHQMWIKGGSECGGLYPPPSLYALLRLYLLPDIAEEHKHSLVLYLLVDYSMIYDDVRYETVIRRLMQFPTMFGLSNTAIKATQAFWHLDHRDFDFALDQLQCLTGNTLSEWQHNVVLSSLLAQKKTQAALQYLHVRKPAPIQNIKDGDYSRVNDHNKLEDWHSCCNLYLARGLVYEALDVIRMCVQNAGSLSDKTQVLNMFFQGCRNTGNLSKILSITLLPYEEEVFIKYMENCNQPQTSDILIMYYLQQARYLEAERYNTKLRHAKPKSKDVTASVESLFESNDRESARDNLVVAMCAALPTIAETVARCALDQRDVDWHVNAPKPMSVFVQAKSPKNTFIYKSSFIQDTIQNASETWMNRPKMRKGIKRLLNIEETPFICTPKLSRSRSIFTDQQSESTPPKRARLNLTGTPKTPRSAFKASEKLSSQMEKMLDMPEVQSPVRMYERAETPHSILKSRLHSRADAPSPCGSRYLEDTDDELEMETASNHTHYSDSTNKHLRFTIPTPTEPGSATTPSPLPIRKMPSFELSKERELSSAEREKEMDVSTAESYVTTASHAMNESNPLESPPKKLATEEKITIKKAYKDTVRARQSHSISANSSLSEDPNTSIESIADIPITLINPRYSGPRRRSQSTETRESSDDKTETEDTRYGEARRRQRSMSTESTRGSFYEEDTETEKSVDRLELPKTPSGRRSIRSGGESTPLRSCSITPERQDSPATTPLRTSRISRSRSKTPELSPRSSPLAVILEQPTQEVESEPHADGSWLSVPRSLRSRSRTPERLDKGVRGSPKLEAIRESPTKSGTDSPPVSPRRNLRGRSRTPERLDKDVRELPKLEAVKETITKSDTPSPPASPQRSLRSRSRTPEVEVLAEPLMKPSPRSLRSRSKTPEKMSPKKEHSVRTKKSLSRLVLEANTFAKTKQTLELLEAESASESGTDKTETKEIAIECTPLKPLKQVPSLMDMTLSPIVNKSILQSSNDSLSESGNKEPKRIDNTVADLKPMPVFDALQKTYFEKSILYSYQSSIGDSSHSTVEVTKNESGIDLQMPAFTTIHEDFGKSVLNSYESSVAGTSQSVQEETPMKIDTTQSENVIKPDFGSVLHSDQSSVADATQANTSSLITDDSDVEMTETVNKEWAEQKEKEQIVEIEREIHEIEDDMSNDDNVTSESSDDSSSLDVNHQSSAESIADNDEDEDEVVHVNLNDTDSDRTTTPTEFMNTSPLTKEKLDDTDSDRTSTPTEFMNNSPLTKEKLDLQVQRYMKIIKFDSDSESNSTENIKSDSVVELIEDENENVETNPFKAHESLMTEDGSFIEDEVAVSVEATNPLDQAQISLMTDDNSTIVDDVTENYSIEPKPGCSKTQDEMKTLAQSETIIEPLKQTLEPSMQEQDEQRTNVSKQEETHEVAEKAVDPLAQESQITEDISDESDQEISLNYSDDKVDSEPDTSKMPDKEMLSDIITDMNKEITIDLTFSPQSKDVVDTFASKTNVKDDIVTVEKRKDTEEMEIESQTVYESKHVREIPIPVIEEVLKPETGEKVSIPETVKQSFETEQSVTETCNPEIEQKTLTVGNISELETVKQSFETEQSVTETCNPEVGQKISTIENVSELETIKQSSETKSFTETCNPEIGQKTSTVGNVSELETIKQSSVTCNPEIEQVISTVGNVSEIETVKQSSETKSVIETSNPEIGQKISIVGNVSELEIVKQSFETKSVIETSNPEIEQKISTVGNVSEIETVKQSSETKSVIETCNPEIEQKTSKLETFNVETNEIKSTVKEATDKDVIIIIDNYEKMETESQTDELKSNKDNIEKVNVTTEQETLKPIRTRKRIKSTSSNSGIEPKETDEPRTPTTRKRAQSRTKSTEVEILNDAIEKEGPIVESNKIDEPKTGKRAQSRTKSVEIIDSPEDTEAKTPATRKRASKAKPNLPEVTEEIITSSKTLLEDEPKTPITRKRTQSTSQSEETPENVTPSRRKTPSSTEVRKIITRRMSREMREMEESLDDSLTPKRNIHKFDDNESVASASSVASSVQSGESKSRRGKKSTLATKPDLSVIPEVLAEESKEISTEVINEYSGARRLTRHQKSMMDNSRGHRKPSTASRASRSSLSEQDEEERRPAFDLQPIDRISLMNKETYDGTPDEDELNSMSPESIASDASKMRSRMARAASEVKVVKAAKIHRRITSVDILDESSGSPALRTDSPARSRRASFNRAVEALNTPKGRRQSADSRKSLSPGDSPSASEEVTTPSRRGRRGSAQSNTSQSGRSRSKKHQL